MTIADYLTAWNGWLEDCDAIVHVAFSSELSVSCNNARLAAEELPGKVWVVDSLNLSTGFGHLVLDAALMAEKGMDPADIAAEIERLVPKVDVSFVLNTLDYLRKGGPLHLRAGPGREPPGPQALHRGHRRQDDRRQEVPRQDRGGYVQYIKDRLANRSDIDTRRVFITDSGLPDELRQRLREVVLSCQPFEEVYNNRAGCTISGHCGPWCMEFYTTTNKPK